MSEDYDDAADPHAEEVCELKEKIANLKAAIKSECHRLEHDYNAADVTEARRILMAAAASN